MIVRILGEGQYNVPDELRAKLEALDDNLVKAVDSGDESAFVAALLAVTDEVRRSGAVLADDVFPSSDLVVPFADATLEETKKLLSEAVDTASDER
jgi:hypothetical protein